MAIDHEGPIWDALAMGEKAAIRKADTSAFNWAGAHPRFGSVVHAVCFGRISAQNGSFNDLLSEDDEGAKKRLSLLEYVMEQGADPRIIAPATCDEWRNWKQGTGGAETEFVEFAATSAVSCLLAAKRVLKLAMNKVGGWSGKLRRIDSALAIVARASSWRRHGSRASVRERVLVTWASVLADTSTADVAILLQEAASGVGDKVHAHSAVLRAASPVLAAMLSQGMREGERQEISVRECSIEAVKVLLALMYTSGLPEDLAHPSASTLIEAINLAHRWDSRHVVRMLAPEVAKALDSQVIEAAMEVAVLLNVPKLLHECRQFYHRARAGDEGRLRRRPPHSPALHSPAAAAGPMARDHEGPIWDALAMGEETLVRRADTSAFNWMGTHPRFGSVAHAVCFGLIAIVDEQAAGGQNAYYDLIYDTHDGAQQRLSLLEYVMEQGADPRIIAPATCDDWRSWPRGEYDWGDDAETEYVEFAATSAVSCLLAAKRVVTCRHDLGRIERALNRVYRASSWRGDVARASVSERVLGTWARVLADTSAADVVILVQGATSGVGDKVHAHSAVLRAASPVLAAMLSQGMRAREPREISVQECGLAAVKVLLALMYTSGLPEDFAHPSASTLIEAINLAHRCNSQHVVQMLAFAIAGALDSQVIESAMEVAMSLKMPKLLSDCREWVIAHEREMRARLAGQGAKDLPAFKLPAVRAEVARVLRVDLARRPEGGPSKRLRLL